MYRPKGRTGACASALATATGAGLSLNQRGLTTDTTANNTAGTVIMTTAMRFEYGCLLHGVAQLQFGAVKEWLNGWKNETLSQALTRGVGAGGECKWRLQNAMQKTMHINAFASPPPPQNGACDTNLSMDCHNKRKLKGGQMQKNATTKKHLPPPPPQKVQERPIGAATGSQSQPPRPCANPPPPSVEVAFGGYFVLVLLPSTRMWGLWGVRYVTWHAASVRSEQQR